MDGRARHRGRRAARRHHPNAPGESFNICSNATTELVPCGQILAEKLGVAFHELRVPDQWCYALSNAKARRMLGFAPRFGYAAMVDAALAWRRGDRDGVLGALPE